METALVVVKSKSQNRNSELLDTNGNKVLNTRQIFRQQRLTRLRLLPSVVVIDNTRSYNHPEGREQNRTPLYNRRPLQGHTW